MLQEKFLLCKVRDAYAHFPICVQPFECNQQNIIIKTQEQIAPLIIVNCRSGLSRILTKVNKMIS